MTTEQIQQFIQTLTENEARHLLYSWEFWARPNQLLPDGDWRYWLILAGRGFGKTRTGAETVRQWVKHHRLVNIIGATVDDARDIMIEGESGILAICPPHERPEYKVSKRRLEWPNGAWSLIFTADEPDRLRGKQHEKLWMDELAAWRYREAFDQAVFGLRLGTNPQALITTTPRPIPILNELLKDPATHVTRGSTYDNRANLAPAFFSAIIKKYEGTRLGRQELNAEILDDVPGALWTRSLIDKNRVAQPPKFKRVVIGVDPAGSANQETSDETGIIAAGLGEDGHGYILEDLSLIGTPDQWAGRVVLAYYKWQANQIVAETNNGGDMVSHTITTKDKRVTVKKVRATRGKYTRAEPISALYEQGRVHHVGSFPALEDQMCTWIPGEDSPDRLDAAVWALSELMIGSSEPLQAVARHNPYMKRDNRR